MASTIVYNASGRELASANFGANVYVYLYDPDSEVAALDHIEVQWQATPTVARVTVTSTDIADTTEETITTTDHGTVTCRKWKIPLEAMETVCPNGVRSTGNVYVALYYVGKTTGEVVRGDAHWIALNVPSSIKPKANLVISEGNASLPAALKDVVYVQNHSKIKVESNATGNYGSTVTSCLITVSNVTYPSAITVTSDTITTYGTVSIKAVVTDSRGRSITKTATVTVLAYSPPTLTDVAAYRCAGAADTTADRAGAYICVKPSGALTALDGNNAKSCTVYYKKHTDSTYSTASVTMGDYALDTEHLIIPADTNAAYDLYVNLADSISQTTYICTQVPAAGAYIDIPENGQGMGVGKKLEGTGLEVGWDVTIVGSLKFTGSLTGGTESQADSNAPFVWLNSATVDFCPFCKVQVADGYMYFGVSPVNSEFEMVHISTGGTVTVKRLSMT